MFWGLSHRRLIALALAGGLLAGCGSTPPVPAGGFTVTRLDGVRTTLVPQPSTRAWVFVFLSVDCPISNRCLPELNQLARDSVAGGVQFVFVYPNSDELPDTLRKHQQEFGIPGEVYRDPQHELARRLGARVTPEVVLLGVDGQAIYRGRVNDQYTSLGQGRPAPTQHDLAEVLKQLREGNSPGGIVRPAVGCTFRAP
jgi:hypothetical protein